MKSLEYKIVYLIFSAGAESFGTQGASASFPSFMCDIKSELLKKHGEKDFKHNHKTIKCNLRTFESIEEKYRDQVREFGYENIADFESVNDVWEDIEFERKMRGKGKNHASVIGRNCSPLESMEFSCGGDLHNQIGCGNDALKQLFEALDDENLSETKDEIKTVLNSCKAAGGVGCSPGQAHGGAYSGKDITKIFCNHEKMFVKIPNCFTRKIDFKLLFSNLSAIFKITRLSRFLTQQERGALEVHILNLSSIYHSGFKDRSITLKMHDILGMMQTLHLFYCGEYQFICLFYLFLSI